LDRVKLALRRWIFDIRFMVLGRCIRRACTVGRIEFMELEIFAHFDDCVERAVHRAFTCVHVPAEPLALDAVVKAHDVVSQRVHGVFEGQALCGQRGEPFNVAVHHGHQDLRRCGRVRRAQGVHIAGLQAVSKPAHVELVELAEDLEERMLEEGFDHVRAEIDERHFANVSRVERLPAQQPHHFELFMRVPALAGLEAVAQLAEAVQQPTAAGVGTFELRDQPARLVAEDT
jgi:hypothetical protein